MRDYFAPRRYWKWTRWTLIAAGVFFCVLYVQSYRNDWSAAERHTGAVHMPLAPVRAAMPSPFDYPQATRVMVVT